MQRSKVEMKGEKAKFREEFRQRAYGFALDVIGFVEELPRGQTSRIIGDQLLRSATSIGANVVEAQGAASRRDYANFFTYALKSANETKFWLSLLKDARKTEREVTDELLNEVTEIANILAAGILTLKAKKEVKNQR